MAMAVGRSSLGRRLVILVSGFLGKYGVVQDAFSSFIVYIWFMGLSSIQFLCKVAQGDLAILC